MYKKSKAAKTTLLVDESYKGETIEEMLFRIKHNREPLVDGMTPLIYTERKDGVIAEYDPRTDKFEIMVEAHEKVYLQAAANKKAFEEKLEAENKKTEKTDDGKPESTQAPK